VRLSLFLIAIPLLAGCDKLTGAADQKIADAEAIGYACRVSQKTPEACMKENEAQSPSSVLDGWKSADKDIKEKAIDITMSNPPAAMDSAVEAEKPAEEAPAAEGKDGAAPDAAKPAEPAPAAKEEKGKK
jgi:hypothetical protein